MNTEQTIQQIISHITILSKVDVANEILQANTPDRTTLAGDGTRSRAIGASFEDQVFDTLKERFPDAKIYSNIIIYFKHQAPGSKKPQPTMIELDFVIVFNNRVYLVEAKRSLNEELLVSICKKVTFFKKLQESEQDLRNLEPVFTKKNEVKNLSVTIGKEKKVLMENSTMVNGAQMFLDEVNYFKDCELVIACMSSRATEVCMNYAKAARCVLSKASFRDPQIEDIVELDEFKRYYNGLQKIIEDVETSGYREMFGYSSGVILC
mgnify:CR=1 FL=1